MEPQTETEIISLFLHEKPAGIIMSLKESNIKYASILSKEVDCTYTHTLKILTQLENYRLVTFEKNGRIKKVSLTSEGEDVAHELVGLMRKLEKISRHEKNNGSEDEEETEERIVKTH
jgi:predicted transcriptional regulator